MTNKFLSLLALPALFLGLAILSPASAAIQNEAIGALGTNEAGARSGVTFFTYFIYLWNAIITIGGFFVVLNFVWGAIEWIASGGDQAKVSKGRDRITQSIIGLIILVGSFVIIGFISQLFFGESFNLLRVNIPTAPGVTP
ncbi:MAG: hypothetical protein M3Q81_02180 [bacterium]|nr:hypothetical protein [bacterium]